jgi:porphobilinogen synthase
LIGFKRKVKTTLKLKLLNNFKQYYMFPLRRNRRLRTNESIRSLVRETIISPNDFIVPLFVVEGKNVRDEIPSMQNYFRLSLDNLEKEVKELWNLGLKSVLLFVKVPDNLKDNAGKEALNPDGLMQRAIKTVKNVCPHMIVMTDVALDPYSVYGHDGIIENGIIENDKTSLFLAEMSVSHAKAGADIVAPSDMMDGRILEIREALEDEGLINTGILAYSAKYSSAHYGPFRDALDSAPVDAMNIPKDKKTYQMDYHNRLEAIKETRMDIEEGADIVMVKPGIAYLDIVREVKNMSEVPVAVYQVSGEYAMIKAAAEKGWIDHDAVMIEQVTAIKRAGADLIASYFAKDVVKLIS